MAITLDSSGIFALQNETDAAFDDVVRALGAEAPPYIRPVPVMAEVMYLVESRVGQIAMHRLCSDIIRGSFLLDCGESDLNRILYLTQRYVDMPLGFADAAVIACAERNGGRVLTLDRRHFEVVAREGRIVILPERN